MPSSLRWKAALLLFMITFSVMTVLPSFQSVPDWWSKYLAPGGLRLGLDLQGGMHLVMKVNLQKAIENNLDLAYIHATATIRNSTGDTVSVSAQAGIDPNRKGMDIAQSFGSSSSYARKYSLNGLSGINSGTHEIMLSYDFNVSKERKRMKIFRF